MNLVQRDKIVEYQNWSPLFLCKIYFLSYFISLHFFIEALFIGKSVLKIFCPFSSKNGAKTMKNVQFLKIETYRRKRRVRGGEAEEEEGSNKNVSGWGGGEAKCL